MCFSTPTTKQSGGDSASSTAGTTSCTSSSQCPNAANVSSTCNLKPNLDCNGNDKNPISMTSIIHRKNIGTVTLQTTKESNQQNSRTKDLNEPSPSLGFIEENAAYKEIQKIRDESSSVEFQENEFKPEIRWPDLGAQLFLHLGAVYGFYLLFSANFYTFIWRK